MTDKPDDSKKYIANVSDAAIMEALQAVERIRTGDETEIPIDTGDSPDSGPAPQGALRQGGPGLGAAPPATGEFATPEGDDSEAGALRAKLRDERERTLRIAAELQNYKKKVSAEKLELTRFGHARMARALLDVVDNFDRALRGAEAATSKDYDNLLAGLKMIHRQIMEVLKAHGVAPFASAGLPFDPEKHESVDFEETDALPPGCVAIEHKRGYMVHDKLLRAAAVAISRKRSP